MIKTLPTVKCVSISVVIAVSGVVPIQLHGQSVQRLFSTPQLRAELDRLRFQIASGIAIEVPAQEEPLIEMPTFSDDDSDVIYALGGTMRKADGSYTVWINNVAYNHAALPENMEMLLPYSQGQLLIRDPQSTASFTVKPGQVLNLSTGELYESYQYQAVVAAAAAEAARIGVAEALPLDETGSVILDSAAVETTLEAAQEL